ncbi:MAG TPA: response regulator [Verrucomicrobiae bacterium]
MTNREHSSTPRILIVDDNPSIHRDFELVLLDNLEPPGLEADERRMYGPAAQASFSKPACSLDHALSGLEGIEKVKQALAEDRPYQLAFVDIRLHGIDGVETIARVWRMDPRIQIVICTAYADYSWKDLARRLGRTDKLFLLKKPFDNIGVSLLASTLAEKWFLARQAALKLEQMELLVAQRTQKVLALQRLEPPEPHEHSVLPAFPDAPPAGKELPLLLLVEGDAEICRPIAQGLEADYRVIEAEDGEQGLRLAQETVPDIIILASSLPRLDGIGLCRRLKSDELASHIPVILLAARGLEDFQIKALEAGADDCLAKPISLPLLKARVDNLLRSRRKLHEHVSHELSLLPREVAANQLDAQFLRRTIFIIERHLSDFEFDIAALAQKLVVSRRQLFRKLKAVAGSTPNVFIRSLRLKRAAQLLGETSMTVTEITYAVGFSDLKHFRSVFQEHFGVLPGDYARKAPPEEYAKNEPGTTGPGAKE